MLLGAALVAVGATVLYYAVTGNDPRQLLTSAIKPKPAGSSGNAVPPPAASIGQQR